MCHQILFMTGSKGRDALTLSWLCFYSRFSIGFARTSQRLRYVCRHHYVATIQERLILVHCRINTFQRQLEKSLNLALPIDLIAILTKIQQLYSEKKVEVLAPNLLPSAGPTDEVVDSFPSGGGLKLMIQMLQSKRQGWQRRSSLSLHNYAPYKMRWLDRRTRWIGWEVLDPLDMLQLLRRQ